MNELAIFWKGRMDSRVEKQKELKANKQKEKKWQKERAIYAYKTPISLKHYLWKSGFVAFATIALIIVS